MTAAPALLWFRQDLRLSDHAALQAALRYGRQPGGAARWWLHHSLTMLAGALTDRGAPLVLRRGSALEQIPRLAREIGAAEVHTGGGPEKFHTDGAYVRRFVPELTRLGDRHLHAPWAAPAPELAAAGITLGSDDSHRILNLPAGRDRARAAYRALPA